MSGIPQAVLSEHFLERMQGKRLVAAIFTTFRFDPHFFETEVLPVFLDIPLSHAPKLRIVQLEDALRAERDIDIAVYYDKNGLVAGEGSAKLDVRRYPVAHPTGIFHPKVVLALVESTEAAEDGSRARSLLVGCLSANLTRSGWWENVEVGHVEELEEGERTNLKDELQRFVNGLVHAVERRRANDESRRDHRAAAHIHEFLSGLQQRRRRSGNGVLRPHFFSKHTGSFSARQSEQKTDPLVDLLADATANSVSGMCLEILSPYFDGDGGAGPLSDLLEYFEPKEVRLFQPRDAEGRTLCTDDFARLVAGQPAVRWGKLPKELLAGGKTESARDRMLHAKVYRFFEPKRGGREIIYIGSSNLTRAGWQSGGNWEVNCVLEVPPPAKGKRKPDWWLEPLDETPTKFAPRNESEGTASSGGTSLMLRYDWRKPRADAFWGKAEPSPVVEVLRAGRTLFTLSPLPPREWVELSRADAQALADELVSTSLFEVREGEAEPGLLLVQEEGMQGRPSLLLELSAADILKFWALLSVEQRSAYIESHAKLPGDDDPLLATLAPLPVVASFFDHFAGIFHGFASLEEHVQQALEQGAERTADYRLFGRKYDSLGVLLDRLLDDDAASSEGEAANLDAQALGFAEASPQPQADAPVPKRDPVEQYVTLLCARQTLDTLQRRFDEYFAQRAPDVARLNEQLRALEGLREQLAGDDEMRLFLPWFEQWFLQRAKPVVEVTS